MTPSAEVLAGMLLAANALTRPADGHPFRAKFSKSSWGPRQKNRYKPGLPQAQERRAPIVCHLGDAPRPSSWELGGRKGLPPGVKPAKVSA